MLMAKIAEKVMLLRDFLHSQKTTFRRMDSKKFY